jgi:SAM-dependent MidA family methyltransferase
MELALYCPVYGYYEAEEDTIGRRGDYYTSVSVGPLFGELLAGQFAEWLEQVQVTGGEGREGAPGRSKASTSDNSLRLVEAGAHRGELARDILSWMRENRPEISKRLQYVIIEPSERRQSWQKRTLIEFSDKVQWMESLARFTKRLRGIVFSNELIDAFPVHRLGWDASHRCWFEWGVTIERGLFTWAKLPIDGAGLSFTCPLSPVTEVLPDGFTVEVCPAAENWWRQAARLLARGKLLTFDYGLTTEEFLGPKRKAGTLRAYHRHQLVSDVLANPGEQDITSQVNFTALQEAGETAGLKTEALLSQSQFLTGVAARIWKGELAFGEWTAARTRQFQTLTHPEHLGRAFRALVQARA